jgi:hypothetical protein
MSEGGIMGLRQLIPVLGMIGVLAVAAAQVSRLSAQGLPAGMDLTAAATVELRDGQGQTVLRGQFADAQDDDGDRERHAAPVAAGGDTDAAGAAEVEVSRLQNGAMEQEIEVTVRNLAPNTQLTIAIDGVDVGVLTTDSRGRGDFEVEQS